MINQKIMLLRNSNLAKAQTALVISKLNEAGYANIEIVLQSSGDKISKNKFKEFGGKGLFTKEIDELVINEQIDLGIHSAKDIPGKIDKRIVIGAYLEREDVRDVVVTGDSNIKKLSQPPTNSSVGTSSPRRIAYIKLLRPDLKIVELRGNIETRISKVIKKIFAIIIAKAGLNRLKKFKRNFYSFTIPESEILPSPGQGAIAITYKK